jgi:hypothetical protein
MSAVKTRIMYIQQGRKAGRIGRRGLARHQGRTGATRQDISLDRRARQPRYALNGDRLTLVEREVFARRLNEAATAARDFARKLIDEQLPEPMLFRLQLNSSYDGNPRVRDEVVFPEDSAFERAEELKICDEQQVVGELWRDRRMPEWIDVAVIGDTGTATLLQLMCCGRFTGDEGLLYHAREGRPPFHVTGPVLPVGYQQGQKFSIYDRCECWSPADLDRLRNHAHKVWSLDLIGRVFDDEALVTLPDLSRMELLELKASSISGRGLLDLVRFPKLRVLRIGLDRNETFQVPKLATARSALELFEIHDPPPRRWGFSDLVDKAPALKWLTFRSKGALFVDGDCPRTVQTLRIADPDARVLAMLSARSADSSSETTPKPMRRGKGVAKTQPPDLKVLKAS